MSLKTKGVEEADKGKQRRCSLVLLPSLLFTFTPTLIISTLICKVFAPVGVYLASPTWTLHSAGPQAAVY